MGGTPPRGPPLATALQVYGSTINHVQDFKYFGSMMASREEKGLHGQCFGWWTVCEDASAFESSLRFSYLIPPVSLSFYMVVICGSCRKLWKARSMPLVPHVIELRSTTRELIGCPMLPSNSGCPASEKCQNPSTEVSGPCT